MTRGSQGDPFRILLVEDNPGDVDLVADALTEAAIPHVLATVPDGIEALAYLRREPRYPDAVIPDLIFLDLNLPRKDGREVLAELKEDDHLKQIPVVVLTSSQAARDLVQSYRLHANCYVTKPGDLIEFFTVMKAIEKFWLGTAKLPPREAAIEVPAGSSSPP